MRAQRIVGRNCTRHQIRALRLDPCIDVLADTAIGPGVGSAGYRSYAGSTSQDAQADHTDKRRTVCCRAPRLALRLRGCVSRILPALPNAIATACLIAFFFVVGWLVPIDPSFFQSSTSVLILLLTTDWLLPLLSGMTFLQSAESSGCMFPRRANSLR